MKSILAVAALVAAIVSPAAAQTGGWYAREQAALARGVPAYGSPARPNVQRHSPNPAWDVYDDRGYVGSDPDPFIRSQIARDPRADD